MEEKVRMELLKHIKAIKDICSDYLGHEAEYLTISMRESSMWINNSYWEDKEKPINITWMKTKHGWRLLGESET